VYSMTRSIVPQRQLLQSSMDSYYNRRPWVEWLPAAIEWNPMYNCAIVS